jgi:hypothetical protein
MASRRTGATRGTSRHQWIGRQYPRSAATHGEHTPPRLSHLRRGTPPIRTSGDSWFNTRWKQCVDLANGEHTLAHHVEGAVIECLARDTAQ